VYLPLVGMAWLVGVIADALGLALARTSQRAATSLRVALPLALVLLMLPPLRASQARFRDDLALWQHALARYPKSDRVCRQWANATAKIRGAAHGLAATDACIAHFGPSLFARNRAVLLARLGRAAEAHATY
jgi:predicted RNA polymerase sigma factor